MNYTYYTELHNTTVNAELEVVVAYFRILLLYVWKDSGNNKNPKTLTMGIQTYRKNQETINRQTDHKHQLPYIAQKILITLVCSQQCTIS